MNNFQGRQFFGWARFFFGERTQVWWAIYECFMHIWSVFSDNSRTEPGQFFTDPISTHNFCYWCRCSRNTCTHTHTKANTPTRLVGFVLRCDSRSFVYFGYTDFFCGFFVFVLFGFGKTSGREKSVDTQTIWSSFSGTGGPSQRVESQAEIFCVRQIFGIVDVDRVWVFFLYSCVFVYVCMFCSDDDFNSVLLVVCFWFWSFLFCLCAIFFFDLSNCVG